MGNQVVRVGEIEELEDKVVCLYEVERVRKVEIE